MFHDWLEHNDYAQNHNNLIKGPDYPGRHYKKHTTQCQATPVQPKIAGGIIINNNAFKFNEAEIQGASKNLKDYLDNTLPKESNIQFSSSSPP